MLDFFLGGVYKLPGAKLAQFSLVGAAGIRSGASWALLGRLLAFLVADLAPWDSILEGFGHFLSLKGSVEWRSH